MDPVGDDARARSRIGQGHAGDPGRTMAERPHRVEHVRDEPRSGVQPAPRSLRVRAAVAQRDGDATPPQGPDQRRRAVELGGERDQPHRWIRVVAGDARRRRPQERSAVYAGMLGREERTLEVDAGQPVARLGHPIGDVGEDRLDAVVLCGRQGRQPARDPSPGEHVVDRVERVTTFERFATCRAVDLEVDQPGSDDAVVVDVGRSGRTPATGRGHAAALDRDPAGCGPPARIEHAPGDEQAGHGTTGGGCMAAIAARRRARTRRAPRISTPSMRRQSPCGAEGR